jgi:hypothetical protein
MTRFATAVGYLACLVGCAGGAPTSYSPNSASSSTYEQSQPYTPTIENDPYSPTIDVTTKAGQTGQAGPGIQISVLFAKIDKKSGAVVTGVQWGEVYIDSEWRFYSRASSSKGQAYTFSRVDNKVSKCSSGTCVYSETDNIMIPAADHKSGAVDGISFKIYGRKGDERVVALPATLIEEFNAKVAEAVKMRAART